MKVKKIRLKGIISIDDEDGYYVRIREHGDRSEIGRGFVYFDEVDLGQVERDGDVIAITVEIITRPNK